MTTLRLRILFDDVMIGPGKAELLGHIRETGSIAAAGRKMEMSYKRAWMLIEDMNAAFQEPLVISTRGGPGAGGAQLTETGQRVLGLYHDIVATAQTAAASSIGAMESLLRPAAERDMSGGK